MFKVIAIELLDPEPELAAILKKGAKERSLKKRQRMNRYHSIVRVLKREQPFYFYQGYKIKDGKIVETPKNPLDDDFYALSVENSHMPTISISAIVGENGSGKSSLIELMMRMLNNLAYACRSALGARYAEQYVFIPDVYARLYYEYGEGYFGSVTVENSKVSVYMSNGWDGNGEQKDSVDATVSQFSYNIASFLLSNLFYAILVDYSAYGFDTYDYQAEWVNIGGGEKCWFDELYHKNDAYQVPIVITPQRDEGSIDYHNETSLFAERVYHLVLGENPVLDLFNGKKVVGFKFDVDSESGFMPKKSQFDSPKMVDVLKRLNLIKDDDTDSDVTKQCEDYGKAILKAWGGKLQEEVSSLDTSISTLTKNYLAYKTLKIACTYRKYKVYKKFIISKYYEEYIDELLREDTHITSKLRRCLALLILIKRNVTYLDGKDKSLNEYKDFISRAKAAIENRTISWKDEDFWPAPSHKTTLLLEHQRGEKKGENVQFSMLSSGEKHLLSIVAAITYHIYNIRSRHKDSNDGLIKYDNVCIVCDEVELYAHPTYQIRLIDYLISAIRGLDWSGDRSIEGIQIIFATHSPFILSDIPSCNLLCLQDGKPQYNKLQKTFGANVYDLLTNQFFMHGFVGEFASKQISEIITLYNQKDTEEKRKRIKEKHIMMKCVAEQIGDNYIRNTLNEMIDEMSREL